MKRILPPEILISIGAAVFIFFKFVVVKAACFAYPADHGEWSSFWEMMVFAYTHDENLNGVRYELFGPVFFFKDYVYVFCLISVIWGVGVIFIDLHRAGAKTHK